MNELVLITPQKKNSSLEVNALLIEGLLRDGGFIRRDSTNHLMTLEACITIIKILVDEINLQYKSDSEINVFIELTNEEKDFLSSIF
ncbi:hypothetical protein H4J51_01000 [Colwellia sp. MB02u-18]|uniref:hypothetical protein n=1 Tax=unclassified Colwellia TaxID=196834 RepID=UPI0015F4EDC0|nr:MULTISPECIES: hypothetical protein [unclassified Colwellia]MBA6222993.1 hypothetical protein [Colwellia sp. MB3u-45]MBA6266786.1 hypothetical protein [Colwellia sp. MB3u-43]MBA6320598.1 hypothetical protein [Colwellia sp. MB02u-19]MBA6323154.1 hypothetical protein [Colwellia sp. MB02u-18]MBA6331819.1 hypothetical protein [Colwellia sp. MB02u-12]